MKNKYFNYSFMLLVATLLTACGGGGGGGDDGGQSSATTSVTTTVDRDGAVISLSDGSIVTFDAGVVQDETQITVKSTAQPAPNTTQEVQPLSPSIEIILPSDSVIDTLGSDSGITVEFPVSDNTTSVAAKPTDASKTAALTSTANGLFNTTALNSAANGLFNVATNVVEMTVVNTGTELEKQSTYFGNLIPNAVGNAVVKIGKDVLGPLLFPAKIIIGAKNAIECTKQSTELYQVGMENGEPVFSTDIQRNGKPPLILVHGWQELAIIGFSCNKPYSSTWQTFLEEFALDPAIADQFQVFSLGYSTSNSIAEAGKGLAQVLQTQFGQDPSYVVAHSMGGVVARAALINEKANINGLVMLATPNHGTPIASQEAVDLIGTRAWYVILDFIIGGEGIKDLAWDNFDNILQYNDRRGNPGNPVLYFLNDEDTNFGRYAVFAGNDYSLSEALIYSYLYHYLGYENDTVVPVPSALFYISDSVQDSRLKQQKLYDGLTHLNIMDDEQVLADTRGALLDFLAILPTPIPGNSDGATSVSVNSTIETSFIRPIFGSTLNTSTFQIAGPEGAVVGTITYNTNTYTAIFTPSSPLAYNTRYTATITTGVKDTLANSMNSNFSWSFTTGLAVNTAPEGYVQFEEGDPGLEGDGIFVESSQIEFSKMSVTMDPKPLIGANRDGTTITVFTELPSDQEFAQLSFEFGYLGTSCLVLVNDNNAVTGLTVFGEAAFYNFPYLTQLTDSVRQLFTSGERITNTSGCSNASVSNMFLNRIEFLKFNQEPVKVDAVTVDLGAVRR